MKTNHIISLIARIREQANRFITQELNKLNLKGLAPSHGGILVNLYKNNSITMKELANQIDRDKSTVTALVDKLANLGYVIKKKDEVDSRVTWVILTEKGEQLQPDFEDISKKLLDRVYQDFSEQEKELVISLLTKINNNW